MPRQGHLLTALASPGFRRLLAVRLVGQFGDGVVQASLAGAVLFNPERQAHASDIAAGFAVLLVPYSVIGPFAGVLLDRWRRQRVLVVVNVVRVLGVVVVAVEIFGGYTGVLFYGCALVVVSMSRFFLAALSASLPHLVRPDDLVTANALSTTSGAIATTVGGALAVGFRSLTSSSNHAYAVIAVAAMLPYAVSALAARPFDPDILGPDDVERANRETAVEVVRGLAAGARHVRARRPVFHALLAITAHRLCYGIGTICTLLLYRNYFHNEGVFRAGLGGLAQVVAAIAVGGAIAAVVTPTGARRLGYARYPALLLGCAAAVEVALGLPFTMPLLLLAAVLLGIASQGIKICVDTLVQHLVEDQYRGRVFSLYDAMFNLTLVAAAVLTAVALPENGHSVPAVLIIAGGYAVTGAVYLRVAGREASSPELPDQRRVEAA